jgi:aminopeptidase N
VAGDLDLLEDHFVTKSGRVVKLQLFVDKGKLDQSQFAMESLKNAMRWDERRYNLEYDLDLYMIVAVGDFNMGAMENKGLNIFNTKYVLANPQTATDQDFENIESVIGHEYFHNWTGNRVTCRDWFQLSLKEGLTVFRDQQFTEDMRSKTVKRIDDVKIIRSHQFAEDAGPMAHPIRPESYIEMNNFYTVTVYNKGAEVIRMLHTLLGEEGFQKGMALYFRRHDGSAATCDDFVAAMADANEVDLESFKAWYAQAGTPNLTVHFEYLANSQQLLINFKQCNDHPSALRPFVIPVKLGLVGVSGANLSFKLSAAGKVQNEALLIIDQMEQQVVLEEVSEQAIPSLLRDFSAPVKLKANYTPHDYARLFAHDSNSFNRWDAGQSLMTQYIATDDDQLLKLIVDGFVNILRAESIDNAFKARALSLPDLKTLFELHHEKGVDHLVLRHKRLKMEVAKQLESDWLKVYQDFHVPGDNSIEQSAAANRAIKNLALSYLVLASDEHDILVHQQYEQARLMTDELAALTTATHCRIKGFEAIVEAFYSKWKAEALVMDKWLSVQATVDHSDTLDNVSVLQKNPVFSMSNPNKVRALLGSFASQNFAQFHVSNGGGYQLIADAILSLDPINPQVAASLAKQFSGAPKLDATRQNRITEQLNKILEQPKLSKDVYEIVTKTVDMLKGGSNGHS